MKIKLSKTQWQFVGKKAGWLKRTATSKLLGGVLYINWEDWSSNFWGHDYLIQVGTVGTMNFLINSSNEGDAIDILIDYFEKNMPQQLVPEGKIGIIDNLDEYITGGNHGRTMATPASEIFIKEMKNPTFKPKEPQEPQEPKPEWDAYDPDLILREFGKPRK